MKRLRELSRKPRKVSVQLKDEIRLHILREGQCCRKSKEHSRRDFIDTPALGGREIQKMTSTGVVDGESKCEA
jgi:hypothetical protein